MGLKDRDYIQEREKARELKYGKSSNYKSGWSNSTGNDLNTRDAVLWCSLGLNVVLLIALFSR